MFKSEKFNFVKFVRKKWQKICKIFLHGKAALWTPEV